MLTEFVTAALEPLYVSWSLVWLLVLRYYAEAAYVSWRQSGGHWLGAPRELRHISSCVLVDAVRALIGRGPTIGVTRYARGHLLQLGIAMSSVASALLGLLFWSTDRSDYSEWFALTIYVAVLLSTAGGLVHLYFPMSLGRMRAWKLTWLLVLIGPIVCAVSRLALK